ncbi:dipeptidyl-peptidase 3 family protein [Tamlana flava]|uniref:dipeptidyl-peptidase 3 family protein n=1 Tax=Tamlana flava TaxID=3158572 RepID=UPI00351AF1F3
MNLKSILNLALVFTILFSCGNENSKKIEGAMAYNETAEFDFFVEQFADVKVLRYEVPGWDVLTLNEQKLVYYLTQAGLAGRDIMWDQNYKHNLKIRKELEHVYTNYSGDKSSEDWKAFEIYLKRVWFSNGIHHHYSNDKLKPEFSADYLKMLLTETNTDLDSDILEILFNEVDTKKVNQGKGVDNASLSAVNFYGPDVTNEDVANYYKTKTSPNPEKPLAFGINSQLVKENGEVKERIYKSGGLYGEAIDEIIKWLELAKGVAENEAQANALGLLIDYYKTGDLQTWDDYNVAWTNATEGNVDYINGFVEVYNDPLGYTGSYEMIVQINDFDMSQKMKVLSDNAQWFEDNSTLIEAHKKENVVGVTYKVVNVAGEAGDASPSTPIGVNLPNSSWIRAAVGSKSVSLGNIINASNKASSAGRTKEFVHDEEEFKNHEQYGELADKLETALHEVIGHASGQLNPGVPETKETLKNYASTLEEGRADLVALYYMYHPKLQELGLVDDWEAVGRASYDAYIRNGLLVQLVRLNLGDDVEEAHMRNRQWISAWVFEKGQKENIIEKVTKEGKTYYNINDYAKLRDLFGQLLREAQRIKSEGDYAAVEALVEGYGVKVDQAIHTEVLERNKQYKSAPYTGYVNPILVAEKDDSGEIVSIKITQPKTFAEQMLNYSDQYNFLPDVN